MRRMRFRGVPFLLLGIAWIGLFSLIIFGLWNTLMPDVFGVRAITYWQALGLLALSRILFGRFDGWGSRMRRARFARGFDSLTPEERDRFRRAMDSHGPRRCGGGPPAEQG